MAICSMPASFLRSRLLNLRISVSTVHTVEVVDSLRAKTDADSAIGEWPQFIWLINQVDGSAPTEEIILGYPFDRPVFGIIFHFLIRLVVQGEYHG